VVMNGPSLELTRRQAHTARAENTASPSCAAGWGSWAPKTAWDLALRAIDYLIHVIGRTDCHFAFVGDGEARAANRSKLAGGNSGFPDG